MPAPGGVQGTMAQNVSLSPAEQKETGSQPSEPSAEEQVEQIKELLDWLSEIKDEIDEDIWLNLTAALEEILKELGAD